MSIAIFDWKSLDDDARTALLQRPAVRDDSGIRSQVVEIIARVQSGGDRALLDLPEELDGVRLDSLRVSAAEIDRAIATLSAADIAAIDLAITNVRCFHEQQLPDPVSVETMPGVRCERVSHPIDAVGLYVPAGTAPLPSAAVMLAVPAAPPGGPDPGRGATAPARVF